MEHLALMGEGTASVNRQYSVGSDTFLAMAAIYQGEDFKLKLIYICTRTLCCLSMRHFLIQTLISAELYGREDGSITATFQVILLTRQYLFPVDYKPSYSHIQRTLL
jgi:hypothetical protein